MNTRIRKYLYSSSGPTKLEWGLLFFLASFLLASFEYKDMASILHFEVNFSGSIANGKGILGFYDYSKEMADYYREIKLIGSHYATYEFPMHLLLGLWGIPLYFISTATGIEAVTSFGMVFYGKFIYIAALAFSGRQIYKICQQLGVQENHCQWAAFLFSSSILIFTNVCVIGQSDILGFPFTLLGIRALLEKKNGMFIFWFAIAVTFKMYSFFIFVALILITDKKVYRIIMKILAGLSLYSVCTLLFSQSEAVAIDKSEFLNWAFEKLTDVKLPVLNATVPLVIFLLLILYIYCYCKPIASEGELNAHIVFSPLAAMSIVFVSFDSYPYWYVNLVPFLAIAAVYNNKHFSKIILLETIGLICLTIGQYVQFNWCFEPFYGKYMLLEKLFGEIDTVSHQFYLEELVASLNIKKAMITGLFYSGYLACILSVLWICRPVKSQTDDIAPPTAVTRASVITRAAINFAIASVPVLLYIAAIMQRSD